MSGSADVVRERLAARSGLLPSECPNCGRRHEGANFDTDPGPVQRERDGLLSRVTELETALRAYAKFADVIAVLSDARTSDYVALCDALAGVAATDTEEERT